MRKELTCGGSEGVFGESFGPLLLLALGEVSDVSLFDFFICLAALLNKLSPISLASFIFLHS